MGALTEDECLDFLQRIETGELTLEPVHCAQDVFAGDVEYLASNGWSLVVFNDANEWDYIERISSGDGRKIGFEEISESMTRLSHYSPTLEVSWKVYRIPGYCDHRCELCDRDIQGGWTIVDRRMSCHHCSPPETAAAKPRRAPHRVVRREDPRRQRRRR
ncbi:MAG: hypothetical protein J0I12_35315 [Candidatus Eremiobacteraeota bacterium]|nr:hypothetical protein [Candidatus Eremiobacteraeota bacterium]